MSGYGWRSYPLQLLTDAELEAEEPLRIDVLIERIREAVAEVAERHGPDAYVSVDVDAWDGITGFTAWRPPTDAELAGIEAAKTARRAEESARRREVERQRRENVGASRLTLAEAMSRAKGD